MADHSDERAPLLSGSHIQSFPEPTTESTSHHTSTSSSSPPFFSKASLQRLAHRAVHLTTAEKVVLVNFVSIFLVELALGTANPAISSMIETIVCRQRYGNTVLVSHGGSGSAVDPRCKASDIQGRLSELLGWQTAFECIPSILFSVPYGILADNLGRKPVMLLAWTGLGLQLGWYLTVFYFRNIFPLWALWFTALFGSLGSFQSVGPAMVFTVLGDVTPQADRANCYFRLTAVFLVAELISNPMGGMLLLWGGHWTPLLFGFVGVVLSGLVLLLMPETLNFDQAEGKVAPVVVVETPEDVDGVVPTPCKGRLASAWQQFVHLVQTDARATSLFILRNRPLMFLMIPFIFSIVGRFVQQLLLQYATKRYGWSWSQAAFLLTIRSTTNLLLCLVLLPLLSAALLRSGATFGIHGSSLRKDLWLARVSGLLLVFGSLLVAFAVTPWLLSIALVVFSLGGGYSPTMRSILNAFVEPHHLAMLNTLLGLLEFSGLMVAAPVLFRALQKGVDLGGPWTGLPFLISAAMCLVSTAVVVVFRFPRPMLQKEAEVAAEAKARRRQQQEDDEAGEIPAEV